MQFASLWLTPTSRWQKCDASLRDCKPAHAVPVPFASLLPPLACAEQECEQTRCGPHALPQVKQLCTAKRSRPGCAACLPSFDAAKTYGSCDLLGTWGGICAAEPSESRGV